MLSGYNDLTVKELETMEVLNNINQSDLNADALSYYLEVLGRINQKPADLNAYISEHSGNG